MFMAYIQTCLFILYISNKEVITPSSLDNYSTPIGKQTGSDKAGHCEVEDSAHGPVSKGMHSRGITAGRVINVQSFTGIAIVHLVQHLTTIIFNCRKCTTCTTHVDIL